MINKMGEQPQKLNKLQRNSFKHSQRGIDFKAHKQLVKKEVKYADE